MADAVAHAAEAAVDRDAWQEDAARELAKRLQIPEERVKELCYTRGWGANIQLETGQVHWHRWAHELSEPSSNLIEYVHQWDDTAAFWVFYWQARFCD